MWGEKSPIANPELHLANPEFPWDWHCLSQNPNITWDIVLENSNKPWDTEDCLQIQISLVTSYGSFFGRKTQFEMVDIPACQAGRFVSAD
jgi:hypothetical protein